MPYEMIEIVDDGSDELTTPDMSLEELDKLIIAEAFAQLPPVLVPAVQSGITAVTGRVF